MKTFLDIIQVPEYRKCAVERLSLIAENSNYHFPTTFPSLYQYRPISSYAVNDIINRQLTATSIGEFNDLFDGAIHRYGSVHEQIEAAEQKWGKIESHLQAANLPDSVLKHSDSITLYQKHFKEESRSGFDLLNYLGTYVSCFSEQQSSTLMWAHYADSNKGMCITYNFNQLATKDLFRYLLFPVAYSKHPIELVELLEDKENRTCPYPIDTAVLCAALNKASIWNYEHEWRIIFVLATNCDHPQRLPLMIHLRPTSICFGYHFLKKFFYYDFKNEEEREAGEKNIKNFKRLLDYMIEQTIPAAIMWPDVGSYNLSPRNISPIILLDFVKSYFEDDVALNMRYYRTVHNHLNDFLDIHISTI